jgi:proteasome lid subunit RPN8/RPN11
MVADASFVVCIPAAMYAEMVAHVVVGYPNETCGLLASKDGQVVKNYPTTNAAEHPDDFSVIDAEDLRRIFEDIDTYDGQDYAYYH